MRVRAGPTTCQRAASGGRTRRRSRARAHNGRSARRARTSPTPSGSRRCWCSARRFRARSTTSAASSRRSDLTRPLRQAGKGPGRYGVEDRYDPRPATTCFQVAVRREVSVSRLLAPGESVACGRHGVGADCGRAAVEGSRRSFADRRPDAANLRSRAEGCPSGLRSATGNRVCAERCIEGSNPSPSASSKARPCAGFRVGKAAVRCRLGRSGRVAEGGALLRR